MEEINITDTKLYEILREVVGKDKAEEALNGVKSLVKEEVSTGVKMLATKEQWLATKEELAQKIFDTKSELLQKITETREELSQKITETKQELNQKISETKEELNQKIIETKEELNQKITETREDLSLKIAETKSELIRTIYIVGLIQFLAIVGAVLGIMTFILRYVKD